MGIVKSARAIGRVAGQVIDEEDRQLLHVGLVYLFALGVAAVMVAASVALAWRVFEAIERA